MIAALFDTNVIYSALVRPQSTAETLLRLATQGKFELWISAGILTELCAILARPKAQKELGRSYSPEEISDLIESIAYSFYNIGECPVTDLVEGDPKDNHVVSAAIYAQVDYLVSGDKKHILPLKNHPGLRAVGLEVVTVSEFAAVLASQLEL